MVGGAAALGLVGAAGTAAGSAPAEGGEPFGPGSARPLADGGPPGPEYTVKGNADSKLYHTTESPYYVRTRAEAWFASVEAAEAAGFAPWNLRRRAAAIQGLTAEPPTFSPGPYPGSALPAADGSAPSPEFTVKGKRRFHVVPHQGLALLQPDEGRGVVPHSCRRESGRLHRVPPPLTGTTR